MTGRGHSGHSTLIAAIGHAQNDQICATADLPKIVLRTAQIGGYFVALASALITVRVPGTSQGGGVRRGGLIGG
jgi:hypothetical protein